MLSIDLQTVFGMPPVEFVLLAAANSCTHISAALGPTPWNPCKFPAWSLRDDVQLRRETKRALQDEGVSIYVGEGFVIRPTISVRDLGRDLDVMAELGAVKINTVCMEPDLERGMDELARLSEMSSARGMGLLLEFAPPHPINNLKAALSALAHIGDTGAKLTLDTMHFFRSGSVASDLSAIDPELIGYIQLCDVPLKPMYDEYLKEASFRRLSPGDGELPLQDFLALLPKGLPIGLEVPMIDAAESGNLKMEIARTVNSARSLLDSSYYFSA